MRRLAVAIALCLGLSLAAGAAPSTASADLLTPEERAWLAAHPRIVLGAGEDWAPSVVKDADGRLSGFIFDHMALLNRKLGTDMRIEAGPWAEMVRKAEAGEIDGLTLTAPLEARKARFLFTDEFFTVYDFLFLRTEDLQRPPVPDRLHHLRGMRVGYLKGTLRIDRVLAEYPDITAVTAESYAALAQQLLAGEIDAAIASYSLEYWRASNGVMGISPTRIIPDTEASMVMTIRRDRPELVSILNKGLAAVTRGELEPLFRRWFGADYLTEMARARPRFTGEERAWLAAHPVLQAAIDPAWAPVEFTDEAGVARGMSTAYLERLGEILGVRFEVSPRLTWTEALRRLGAKELDVLPAIVATTERERHIRFTRSYLSFPAAIFSAADVAYLGGPEALKGRTVAVVRDEAVHDWLRETWPDLVLTPVTDTREALRKVAAGEAFAFIGNLVTTSYYIGQSGLTQIKVAGETDFRYQLAMGVRNDWPILVGILDKALEAIPPNERDAIYRDWISVQYKHSVDFRLLWWVIGVAGLILLAIFIERSVALRRANARLQKLAREISLVEERERRRLAGELHDSPMQKLALAQMQFGAAGKDVAEGASERMTVGLGLMREALDELRSLQFELSPPMLYQEGLGPALNWLASHASGRSETEFSFRAPASMVRVPQDLAILLFQCARELVYNAAKHAGARSAAIELEARESEIVLSVADDGRGLPEPAGSRETDGGGFGLRSIRERLALVGGEMEIVSGATGTRATIRVPAASQELPRATAAAEASFGTPPTADRRPAPS